MIYLYQRKNPPLSNYLDLVDRKILSWSDSMRFNGYTSLILHRLRLPKNWTKNHHHRFKYKSLKTLKTEYIIEDNIVLLHNPKDINDLLFFIQDPKVLEKDLWILMDNTFTLNDLNLDPSTYVLVHNLESLEGLQKEIIRDKKIDQLFNI